MTTYHQPTNWFLAISDHVRVEPDRRGEVWIVCPSCKEGRKKFSFSVRGAKCFLCGYQPALKELAELLGVRSDRPYAQPKPVTRPRTYRAHAWQDKAERITADMASERGAFQAWQAYKPINSETFKRNQLGFGVFPGGLWDAPQEMRCHHPRLIVPLTDGKRVVGFRARATSCSCTKWLSPGGSRLVLYNAQRLKPGVDVLVICENPIDALLVGQEWEGLAVATLGVSIWKDEYTQSLKGCIPQSVVVWFDNDVPGQTTNPAIIADWQAKRVARNLPADETKFLAGIKLTNRLLEAGLPATFYRWPNTAADGADLGGFFK